MKTRLILYADEGKILTDGKTYGTEIYLADSGEADKFTEITMEEYNAIMEAEKPEETI